MSGPYRTPAEVLDGTIGLAEWPFPEDSAPSRNYGICPKCRAPRINVSHYCTGGLFCRVRVEHMHVRCETCKWKGKTKIAGAR